jgi:hypothetical protein
MMKTHLLIIGLVFLCAPLAQAQQRSKKAIDEVKYKGSTVAAPQQCLLAFREFFRYLQEDGPGIVRDEQAQKLFLTESLRKALVQKVATFTDPSGDPDFPGNGTFVGSWDYPSTYSVVASRRYGKRAVIDVLYKWGPKTNYPGDERTTSFIYLFEDGKWKLDDIYTFRGEFAQAESLNQYFREKR